MGLTACPAPANCAARGHDRERAHHPGRERGKRCQRLRHPPRLRDEEEPGVEQGRGCGSRPLEGWGRGRCAHPPQEEGQAAGGERNPLGRQQHPHHPHEHQGEGREGESPGRGGPPDPLPHLHRDGEGEHDECDAPPRGPGLVQPDKRGAALLPPAGHAQRPGGGRHVQPGEPSGHGIPPSHADHAGHAAAAGEQHGRGRGDRRKEVSG
mmetsp:Transcript_2758/g.8361  ORF Transcript_2758/g.8361 Transcript_2758/m.8361 type:complete len:209 (-) Transcript_2758:541-1167(-)